MTKSELAKAIDSKKLDIIESYLEWSFCAGLLLDNGGLLDDGNVFVSYAAGGEHPGFSWGALRASILARPHFYTRTLPRVGIELDQIAY